MQGKMSKAERAIHRLSELNKLVFALREAGRKGGLWKESDEVRSLRKQAVRESRVSYRKKR